MNTKYKTPSAPGVSRGLGRPVGILPLASRPALPPGQRKTNSSERRPLKRTPSTGSVSSINSARSLQSSISSQRGPKRKEKDLGDYEDDGDCRDEDDGACGGQDIVFIDNNQMSRESSTVSSRSSSRKEKKVLTTAEILEMCQEQEPYKVYEVDLHGAELTHMPDLEKFRKLRILDASGNYLKAICNLDFNKDLRELKLYDNKISKIEGLENLKDLSCLQLQHNKISSLGKALVPLKKLQSLRLDSNKLSKIETPELLSCSALTCLDLSNNQLQTLAPLSYLPNLAELIASGNALRKIGDITKCKKLHELDLSRNGLFDLTGIANLPNLKILDISQNQLTSLKTVGRLKSLEELNINANRVSDLAYFSSAFPKLQILFACDNMISRWDEVCALSSLPELVELYLSANPFTMEDGEMPTYHQHIIYALPNLEVIDGVTIKKSSNKGGTAPVMRPMSAASVISVRQVDSQMKFATNEQETLQKSISEKLQSIKSLLDSLPSEAPRPLSRPISTASSSRCSSRLRIREAQQFAAKVNIVKDDEDFND